jgi:hypothetical protein
MGRFSISLVTDYSEERRARIRFLVNPVQWLIFLLFQFQQPRGFGLEGGQFHQVRSKRLFVGT